MCGEGPTWEAGCPFCPGNEEAELEVMRVPADISWQVRVVANRYPALVKTAVLERDYHGLVRRISGVGYHEVTIESPTHNACYHARSARQHRTRLSSIRRPRLAGAARPTHRIHGIFTTTGVRRARRCATRGTRRIITMPMVPSDVHVHADTTRMHFDKAGVCAYCEMLEQERADRSRIVLESERFAAAFSPYAAFSPFICGSCPRRTPPPFSMSRRWR